MDMKNLLNKSMIMYLDNVLFLYCVYLIRFLDDLGKNLAVPSKNAMTFLTSACISSIPQENRPKGTSILQLTVSDRDASHNGPPFTFTVVDGNEGDAFHINQQGTLLTVGVLNRKHKEQYLLQAQVSHTTEVTSVERLH